MRNWKMYLLFIFLFLAVLISIVLLISKKSTPSTPLPEYLIVMVGDSMTERLGNFDELKDGLTNHYPDKSFQVLNYGFGATNILSVQERLQKETFHLRAFQPILNINFDMIIIESFGHNPLSQFPLEDGLKKQNAALDEIVSTIKTSKPNSQIVFMSTIAPNTYKYAEGQVDLSKEKRAEWANERSAYIKNHISYAKSHNIPLLDVYQKSLDESGNGNIEYISLDDFIHPSPTGIRFISKGIADELFNYQLIK